MRRPSMTDRPGGARSQTPAPIGSYGLLGDTRTAALVSGDGAIDWLCVPRFDGEPLFGRLVGGPPAGTFRVGPGRPRHARRAALPAAHRHAGDDLGGGRMPAHPHRGDGGRGRRAAAARDAARATPVGRGRSRSTPSSSSTPASGRAIAHPGSATTVRPSCANGGRSRCPWAAHPSSPSNRAAPPRSRRAGSSGHPRAGRGPPRTADPRRPGGGLGSARSATRPAGGPGRPRSTSRCPSASPSCAAC